MPLKSLNAAGVTLVELLIGVAIIGVVAAGMMAMLDQGNRGMLSLQQKFEVMQLQQDIFRDLADPGICGCNFDATKNVSNGAPLTFDSTNPSASISLAALYASCVANTPGNPLVRRGQPVSPSVPSLSVTQIRVVGIAATGTGSYRGDIVVDFDPEKMVLLRKPATVSINFQADISNPTQARVVGCSTASGGPGSGSGVGAFECAPVAIVPGYNLPRAPLGALYVFSAGPSHPGSFVPSPPGYCAATYYICAASGSASPPTMSWTGMNTGTCEPNGGP